MSYYDSTGYDTGYSRGGGGGGGGGDYSSYSTGAGGGGFLPSNDLSSSQPTSSSPAAMKGKRDPQSLLPVTIRQLLSASSVHDKFQLDGRDVMQVTVVAQVRQMQAMATNVQYTLNDGTGEMLCQVYISEEHPNATRGDVVQYSYVRVIGALKASPDGKRRIQGYHVLAVTDHNDLTYHQIEAIYTHFKHTNKQPSAAPTAAAAAAPTAYGASSYSQPAAAGGPGGAAPMLEPGLSEAHNRVLGAFYHHASEQGASVAEVAATLKMSVQQVNAIVAELSEDGHLYSTIDEEHFKSTRE